MKREYTLPGKPQGSLVSTFKHARVLFCFFSYKSLSSSTFCLLWGKVWESLNYFLNINNVIINLEMENDKMKKIHKHNALSKHLP